MTTTFNCKKVETEKDLSKYVSDEIICFSFSWPLVYNRLRCDHFAEYLIHGLQQARCKTSTPCLLGFDHTHSQTHYLSVYTLASTRLQNRMYQEICCRVNHQLHLYICPSIDQQLKKWFMWDMDDYDGNDDGRIIMNESIRKSYACGS